MTVCIGRFKFSKCDWAVAAIYNAAQMSTKILHISISCWNGQILWGIVSIFSAFLPEALPGNNITAIFHLSNSGLNSKNSVFGPGKKIPALIQMLLHLYRGKSRHCSALLP